MTDKRKQLSVIKAKYSGFVLLFLAQIHWGGGGGDFHFITMAELVADLHL